MKTYNEIYPAEGWADKISKYLQKVAQEKPNMYAKTKRRYENLAYSLLDSASLIASILEEDSLIPKSNDEFNELSESHQILLHEKLHDLTQRFHRTEEFSTSNLGITNPEIDKRSEPYEVDYHSICRFYDSVLQEASIYNFGYSEVNECANLMYQWFHTRFMPDIRDPNFTCQIRYLPSWITSFLIVYGKYCQQKKIPQFSKILDKWCDKVLSGKGGNYAIPYEIYRIEKDFRDRNYEPADYTIDAVIINDILANGCLYKLSDSEYDGAVRYNSTDLADIVKDRNPSLFMKVRTRIANRNNLIREIGLTPVGGIDE